jgi:hypothetical protein
MSKTFANYSIANEMSTLADELLQDFEDSGSEGEELENGRLLTDDSGLNEPAPPSVSRALHVLRCRKDGRVDPILDQPWYTIQLQSGDYKEFQKLVEADEPLWDFVDAKVRYDYFALSGKLVLRTPTLLHGYFIEVLIRDIHRQLDRIADGSGRSAKFAKHVNNDNSPRLEYEVSKEEISKHQPDASFRHSNAMWPGVILEVSYSQKRRDLPKLAHTYIVNSDGSTRAVVGIDLDYNGGKEASISMWRPEYVANAAGQEELVATQTLTNQVSKHFQPASFSFLLHSYFANVSTRVSAINRAT